MTVRVIEKPTYARSGPNSYFRDLLREGDSGAQYRLHRHAAEMRVELPKRAADIERRTQSLRDQGFEFEKRINPNRTDGLGGFFSPPIWLLDDLALFPRAERVLAALARQYPLPEGVSSVNVPRLVTGSSTGSDNDLAAVPDQDITDASVSSPVVTISGHVDVGLQTLEQSPQDSSFDSLILQDLLSSYDANLESQLTIGTGGTSGTLLGLLNVPGIGSVTYTDGSPSFSAMYPKLGNAASLVSDNRKLRPDAWLMRFNRWSWIGTSTNASGHVISPPQDRFIPTPQPSAGATPVGSMLGIAVMTSESIPATQGAGGAQDLVFALRSSDLLLFEGEPKTNVFTDALYGTLSARIELRRYAAALTGRFPSAISVVQGSGMVVQSGE